MLLCRENNFNYNKREQLRQNSTVLDVKITYPPPLQQIPIDNPLTIFGTSTYTTNNSCTVYANSNDLKFQKVIAAGPS